MRTTIAAAAALCAAALIAPAAAQATVRYAAPSGGLTTGNCTTRDTACEVNRAVETVPNPGDEVVLIAGAYEIGADTLFVPGNVNVHGEADARHTHVISTANNYVVALNNDGARIADVTLTHTTGQFGAVSLSSQSTVERVNARSSLAGVQTCQIWKGVMRDTFCWSSGANGTAAGTSLAGPSGTHTPVLANVTAVATGSGSVGVQFNAAGSGVNIQASLRNVIADGTSTDIRAFSSNGATTTSVNAATSAYIQTSDGTGMPGVTPGFVTANNAQGNLPTLPAFISPNTGDFHVKPNALTIDQGADDDSLGTAGRLAQPRPVRRPQAALGPAGDRDREIAPHRPPQDVLLLPAPDFQGRGDLRAQLDHLVIQERDAHLQAEGHRRRVQRARDHVRQAHGHVQVLELRERVPAGELGGKIQRRGIPVVAPDGLANRRREHSLVEPAVRRVRRVAVAGQIERGRTP